MQNNVIKGKWKEGAPVIPANLAGMPFQAEAGAHTFRITCLKADESAASVSGKVTAEVLRSDGVTRVVTGSISGNVVVVTLTSGCYECPGRVTISIKVTESASKTICVYQCHASVARTKSDTEYVDTGTRIPDLASLTQAEEDAEAAAQAANTAAAAADTARLSLQDTVDDAINAAGYPYSASGSSVTIHPVADSRIDFIAHIDPVQSGSGDPSPSNVRAITAPESVKVQDAGANLFNLSNLVAVPGTTMEMVDTGVRLHNDTAATYKGATYGISDVVTDGMTFTLSAHVQYVSGRAVLAVRNVSDNRIARTAAANESTDLSLTYTYSADNPIYLTLFCTGNASAAGDVTFTNVSLVIGDEAPATYTPYAGIREVTLTLPEGTYGGDYDSHGTFVPMRFGNVSSGSRTYANFGSKAGNLYIGNVLASDLTTAGVTIADVSRYFCTMYKPMPYVGIDDREDNCIYFGNGSIYIRDTAHMTSQDSAGLDDYFSWLDSVGGMSVCAPYHPSKAPAATDVDTKTLRATDAAQLNHVWTSNGTIEVSGAQDMQYTIDELRAELAG